MSEDLTKLVSLYDFLVFVKKIDGLIARYEEDQVLPATIMEKITPLMVDVYKKYRATTGVALKVEAGYFPNKIILVIGSAGSSGFYLSDGRTGNDLPASKAPLDDQYHAVELIGWLAQEWQKVINEKDHEWAERRPQLKKLLACLQEIEIIPFESVQEPAESTSGQSEFEQPAPKSPKRRGRPQKQPVTNQAAAPEKKTGQDQKQEPSSKASKKNKAKKPRGFAAMSPEKRREAQKKATATMMANRASRS